MSEDKEEYDVWTEEDLRDFIMNQLRDNQAIALMLLTQHKELTREEFIDRMKKALLVSEYRGWDLGGLLAGITTKSRSYDYESPYSREWRTVGNQWKCYYYLTREEYRPIIREALRARKMPKDSQ